MWVFTVDGLLMPASVPPEADKRLTRRGELDLQVRGRDRVHLARFRKRFFAPHHRVRGRVMASAIELTPSFDYQCRFYTTRAAFGAVLAEAVLEIDYAKFKPAAGAVAGAAYESTLNQIWNAVARDYGAWGSEGYHSKTRGAVALPTYASSADFEEE